MAFGPIVPTSRSRYEREGSRRWEMSGRWGLTHTRQYHVIGQDTHLAVDNAFPSFHGLARGVALRDWLKTEFNLVSDSKVETPAQIDMMDIDGVVCVDITTDWMDSLVGTIVTTQWARSPHIRQDNKVVWLPPSGASISETISHEIEEPFRKIPGGSQREIPVTTLRAVVNVPNGIIPPSLQGFVKKLNSGPFPSASVPTYVKGQVILDSFDGELIHGRNPWPLAENEKAMEAPTSVTLNITFLAIYDPEIYDPLTGEVSGGKETWQDRRQKVGEGAEPIAGEFEVYVRSKYADFNDIWTLLGVEI